MELPEGLKEKYNKLKEETGLNDRELQVLCIKFACIEQPRIAWTSGKPTIVNVKIPRVLLQKFEDLARLYGCTQTELETAIMEQMMLDALMLWSKAILETPSMQQALNGLADITGELRRRIQDDQSAKEE